MVEISNWGPSFQNTTTIMDGTTAFFYGTLMHPKILMRVIKNDGSHLKLCPAILFVSWYSIRFITKTVMANGQHIRTLPAIEYRSVSYLVPPTSLSDFQVDDSTLPILVTLSAVRSGSGLGIFCGPWTWTLRSGPLKLDLVPVRLRPGPGGPVQVWSRFRPSPSQ